MKRARALPRNLPEHWRIPEWRVSAPMRAFWSALCASPISSLAKSTPGSSSVTRRIDPVRTGPPASHSRARRMFRRRGPRRAHRGGDPWDAQDGFRLAGEAREAIEFLRWATPRRSACGSFITRRRTDDRTSRAENRPHAVMRERGHAALVGRDRRDGEPARPGCCRSTIHLPPRMRSAPRRTVSSAPMPGKIVQVFVKPGDRGQARAAARRP